MYQAGEQGRLDDAAIQIAREVGSYYESSGRHIGKPYIDRAGKGQPWTVCAGVTGPAVVPSRYYTPKDCERLETAMYRESLTIARANLVHWEQYNAFVRASFLDVAYNVPSALIGTTLQAKANAGDLTGACMQMPRWVYGTVNGRKTRPAGLGDVQTHCWPLVRVGNVARDAYALLGVLHARPGKHLTPMERCGTSQA